MAKIAAFSNWGRKFIWQLLDYWTEQGHEVQYQLGYNPALHEWSDVCFVDVCDHNAKVASGYKFPNSRLVIRLIDIECWVRQPRAVNWENVDAAIFGAKHMREFVESYLDFPPNVEISHVPFGIDVNKWTFRERDGTGKNVAMIAHRWSGKGLPLIMQVMHKLGPGWKLHCLGTENTERWLHKYLDHIIKELDIDVTFASQVPDVDVWLEDKDVHILPSFKETFSYATAESAAKGIKAITHNWYRAGDVWPRSWIWNTIDECVDMVLNQPYDSQGYRDFIAENYSLDRMMEGINKACQI